MKPRLHVLLVTYFALAAAVWHIHNVACSIEIHHNHQLDSAQQQLSAKVVQNIEQLYNDAHQNPPYKKPTSHLFNKLNSNQHEVLLLLKFARDFPHWNPRKNDSHWQWAGMNNSYPSDNAAFVVHPPAEDNAATSNHEHDDENSSYSKKHKIYNVEEAEDDGYVDLISVPFTQYVPNNDREANRTYTEGFIQSKTIYEIGQARRLLVRMKFSCKILHAERNPNFSAEEVVNPWYDFRLANCGFHVSAGATRYSYTVTNQEIWASYERTNDNSTGQPFTARRRVGRRSRYETIVDAAVEIDNRLKVVNYYVNGYKVWTIYAIGFPPPDDGRTIINRGQGYPHAATFTSVTIGFGTGKCLDESDPNNGQSKQRLVQVLPAKYTRAYGESDTFFDSKGLRTNQVWGQGAIMRLFKLLIIRAGSVPLTQVGLLPDLYVAAKAVPEERVSVLYS